MRHTPVPHWTDYFCNPAYAILIVSSLAIVAVVIASYWF